MTTRGFIGVGRKGISVRYFSSSRVREKEAETNHKICKKTKRNLIN